MATRGRPVSLESVCSSRFWGITPDPGTPISRQATVQYGGLVDASYTIEPDRGLVWIELSGWITPEGMVTVLSEVAEEPDLRPGLSLLVDSQTVDAATTEVIRAVLRPLRRIRERIGPYRIAVAVTSDASFGMTNLAHFHLEPEMIELRGFRSLAEAEAWLLGGPGRGRTKRPDKADPGAPRR